jgi:hypothetical protein
VNAVLPAHGAKLALSEKAGQGHFSSLSPYGAGIVMGLIKKPCAAAVAGE